MCVCIRKRKRGGDHICMQSRFNPSRSNNLPHSLAARVVMILSPIALIPCIISFYSEEGTQWTQSTPLDCGSGSDGDKYLAPCSLEHSPAPTWTQPEHPAGINVWGPNRVRFGKESQKMYNWSWHFKKIKYRKNRWIWMFLSFIDQSKFVLLQYLCSMPQPCNKNHGFVCMFCACMQLS